MVMLVITNKIIVKFSYNVAGHNSFVYDFQQSFDWFSISSAVILSVYNSVIYNI